MDENREWLMAEPPSSPPSIISNTGSRKEKRLPPITPRRFNRFFTPRTSGSSGSISKTASNSRQRLRDITRNGANRGIRSSGSSLGKRVLFEELENAENLPHTPRVSPKKRRMNGILSPESSPLQSSPLKRRRSFTPDVTIYEDEREDEAERISVSPPPPPPKPIQRTSLRSINARVLVRSFGGASVLGRGRVKDHCSSMLPNKSLEALLTTPGWQHQTANFYSLPQHRHRFSVQSAGIPFSSASGHSKLLSSTQST